MNRIEAKMKALQEKGEKAFITYITAGLPDLEGTKKLLKAQEEAGLDVVELGIPFRASNRLYDVLQHHTSLWGRGICEKM